MKRCFVERSNQTIPREDTITIYSITPKTKELRLFREQQLLTINKNDLIYYASIPYDRSSDLLSRKSIKKRGNDLFTSEELGYAPSWSSSISKHQFCCDALIEKKIGELTFDGSFYNSNSSIDYHNELKAYLQGEVHSLPFRVVFPDKTIKYFLNTKDFYGCIFLSPIIQIPRMSYLLHLLLNNNMEQLKKCKASSEELEELLNLFKIAKSMDINLSELRRMQKYLYGVEQSYLGETSTHVVDDLINCSKADKPFIEDVKRIALK